MSLRHLAFWLSGPPPSDPGQPSLTLTISVVLALDLSVQVSANTGRPVLVIESRIADPGRPSLTLSVQVAHPSGQPRLPLEIRVGQKGQPALVLEVRVLSAAAYSGVVHWRPVVRLNGVDISAQLTGSITVEAEENAARIAEFAFRPASGSIRIQDWVGATVAIDWARTVAGAPADPQRIFSGVVDVPEYDPIMRLVRCRCTDDRAGVLAALSRPMIEALIGGYWSPVVFADGADNAAYAEDRLSTVAASLTLDEYRAPQVSAWAAATMPALTFTESAILDGSLGVAFANRSEVVNQMDLSFAYRFPRFKRRVIHAGYRYPFQIEQILIHGYSIPTRDMIRSALAGTGWEPIGEPNWIPVPAGPVLVPLQSAGRVAVWMATDANIHKTITIGARTAPDPSIVVGSQEVADRLTFGYALRLQKRYAQRIEERYAITVRNQASIEILGTIAKSDAAAIEADFDIAAWEKSPTPPGTGFALVEYADVREPDPVPPAVAGIIGEASIDYQAPDADRAACTNAISTLIARAQRQIWASHRRNTVSAAMPLDARLRCGITVRIDTTRLQAKGLVRRLAHALDLASGRAVTEIELALASSQATGIPPHSAPAAPPAPSAAIDPPSEAALIIDAQTWVGGTPTSPPVQDSMMGYFTNVAWGSPLYSSAAPLYEQQFRLQAPQIEAAARDNIVLGTSSSYDAEVIDDELTVTV